MPRNDRIRHRSSFYILAIFLNGLFRNPDDNDDAIADNDKDDDEDADVEHDNDSSKIFLTRDVSRFMLSDVLFTNYV